MRNHTVSLFKSTGLRLFLAIFWVLQTVCGTTHAIFPRIREVIYSNSDQLWVVTDNGDVIRVSDGGGRRENVPFREFTRQMYFLNEAEGWRLDSSGRIWATTDGGGTWAERGSIHWDALDRAADMIFADNQTGWLLTGGSLLLSENGGYSWSQVFPGDAFSADDVNGKFPRSIVTMDANTAYLGMTDGRIFRTPNRGKNWDDVSLNVGYEVGSLFVNGANEIWAGTRSTGLLFNTRDGGRNWQQRLDGKFRNRIDIRSIYFSTPTTGWVTGIYVDSLTSKRDIGVLLKSTDGGKSWMDISEKLSNEPPQKVKFLDGQNGILIGEKSVLRTIDGGDTWQLFYTLN